MPTAVRINRMILGVAEPLRQLVEGVFGVQITDVDVVEQLPTSVDILVIGRQNIRPDDSTRYAYDILDKCLDRCGAKTVVYVLPGRFMRPRYDVDLAAWKRESKRARIFVVEFGLLREMKDAVARGKACVAKRTGNEPVLLLTDELVS
jgi:hypothetical protein